MIRVIAQGVIRGVNAGGVQIAPSIRLVIAMTDIARFVAGRAGSTSLF
jgi:hypothetical protein